MRTIYVISTARLKVKNNGNKDQKINENDDHNKYFGSYYNFDFG